MNLKQENLTIKSKVTVTAGVKNHSQLSNLDFNTSGHTGFASEEALNQLAAIVEGLGAADLEELKQKVDEIATKIENGEIGGAVEPYDDTELRALINTKVSRESGKGLSTNDFDDEWLEKLDSLENYDDKDLRTQIRLIQMVLTSNDTDFDTLQELVTALKNNTSSIGDIFTALAAKIDKVEGKGLSTNDFTTEEKEKLAALEFLPENIVLDENYVHTDNNFTTEEKEKLITLNNYDDTEIKAAIQDTYKKEEIDELVSNIKPNIDYSKLVGQETKSEWIGTVVPDNGYIEKIYFNTVLTTEEVVEICKTLNYIMFEENLMWSCFIEDIGHLLTVIKISEEDYLIQYVSNGEQQFIFSSVKVGLDVPEGWLLDYLNLPNYIDVNVENNLIYIAPDLSFTPENEKANKLFSITPFTQSNEKTILYQLNSDGTLNKDKPIQISGGENGELANRVAAIEEIIGEINSTLDFVNGGGE